jgi:predicted HAD superfamily phosphohydrolase YqeG
MFNKFVPDFIFDKFDDVTTEFLKEQNIEFLFIDIDNTLAP